MHMVTLTPLFVHVAATAQIQMLVNVCMAALMRLFVNVAALTQLFVIVASALAAAGQCAHRRSS